ncbi:DUF6090 family protein [Thalassotalea mangrovi]|uniref:Uncharacterized protein n=1 Tax=Thalassotalea mangrovi TaxID=2572245 RepID=A0A4U1B8J5_9GAMM|nr:DUF6090 family protein [Thalassotalea mangrovi]TKB46916.1 hypothetical protein E8M12_02950 [Thalassotalea mangrovi]
MFLWFRQIRHRLLDNGKFITYCKYALGEIVLIIAGILIALQINVWNEQRKDTAFEQTLLAEIHTSLNADMEYFKFLQTRLSDNFDACRSLINIIANKETIANHKLAELVTQAQANYVFYYNRGSYDALKASGLEKLSDRKLRHSLIRYYDFEVPRIESMIRFTDNSERLMHAESLLWQVGDFVADNDNRFFDIRLQGITTEQLTDPRLLQFIQIQNYRVSHTLYRLEQLLSQTEAVQQQLQGFLTSIQ